MTSLKIPNTLNFFESFIVNFIVWFLPLLFVDLGFSGLEIGILVSVFTVVSLLTSFPIGVINDRLSIREAILAGFLLLAIFLFGIFTVKGFWPFLLFYAIGGLGGNMVYVSVRGLTMKVAGRKDRGKRIGIFQFAATLGGAAGSLLGGLLLYMLNFNLTIVAGAMLMLFMALLSLSVPRMKIERFPLIEYGRSVLKKPVLIFILPLFLFGMHWGAELTSYSLFLKNNLGLDLFWSGLYMGLSLVPMALAAYVAGRRIQGNGGLVKMIFFSGILLSGLMHILMVVPNPQLSFIFRTIHEIGDGMVMVSYYVILSGMFRKKSISGETGLAHTITTLGSVAGALAFGIMGPALGYGMPFVVSGVLSLVCLAFLAAFWGRSARVG
jgi:MFS family permease